MAQRPRETAFDVAVIGLGAMGSAALCHLARVRRAVENWRELEKITGETILTSTGILEAGKSGSRVVRGSLEACELHDLTHERLDADEIRLGAVREDIFGR